ncbi:hypothetical protein SAMN04487968_11025 [Nocardioides terrae]|uniref:Uncharacterized protein n=1 Tax=Nocardioides terrae TaxID=574651 RepID=A0A1I1LFG6_9ACTN|nr:hypothetical protein [Nocardioides terrae]SFC71706.1 hypothetical protein SAMN04487968_11025 [Nocardioides terrae]
MSEEQLDLGGPPRRPNGPLTRLAARLAGRLTARLGRRGTALLIAVALLAAGGWAVAHGALDDPPATPRRSTAASTPPSPSSTPYVGSLEELDGGTPAAPGLPYIRNGILHDVDGRQRALPDGRWHDLARLTDGRVVLVGDGSVTVVGTRGPRSTYPIEGDLARRRDGTAVAWRTPDGPVMELEADDPGPARTTDGRLLSPACRGWESSTEPREPWRSCDEDGDLVSPDGRYVAEVYPRRVRIGLRHASPVLDVRIGRVLDVAWESDGALLVVSYDATTRESRLSRMDAVDGAFDDLFLAGGGKDPGRAALVLP